MSDDGLTYVASPTNVFDGMRLEEREDAFSEFRRNTSNAFPSHPHGINLGGDLLCVFKHVGSFTEIGHAPVLHGMGE
jgi:hypothetical protein